MWSNELYLKEEEKKILHIEYLHVFNKKHELKSASDL